uniref:Glycine cleavage system H protein n=1 Tax=Ascaris suum TaxID=6253 RepID=F1L7I3_ASCSU
MASVSLLRALPRLYISRTALPQFVRAFSTCRALFAERRYTKKHEWVSVDGEIGTVGITVFAQEALGDIVYAELPDIGTELAAGDTAAAVESVKAASDVYSPISGTVTEKNTQVEANPSLINKSTYEHGWLYKLKVKNADELQELMDENAYETFKKQEEEAHS